MIANINLFIKLQEIDQKINTLKSEKASIPELIENSETALKEENKKMEAIKQEFNEKQLEKKDLELDLAETEKNIEKYNIELNNVKSNDLYINILDAIDNEKQKKSELEDKILQDFDDVDQIQNNINEETKKIKKIEANFENQKKDSNTRSNTIEAEINTLKKERNKTIDEINDPESISIYEKIHSHKKGLIFVEVNTNSSSCNGCNIHITPQKISDIQTSTKPVLCENCNRILYIKKED